MAQSRALQDSLHSAQSQISELMRRDTNTNRCARNRSLVALSASFLTRYVRISPVGRRAREWQAEVEALKRSRDDLQRASLQLAEETRAVRTQSDRQNSELSALGSELRARTQTLEDSFRQQVPPCHTLSCIPDHFST